MQQEPILLTPQQAMKILGVSRNVMYEDLLKRDDFPYFKVKRRFYINKEQLQTWVDEQCKKKRRWV